MLALYEGQTFEVFNGMCLWRVSAQQLPLQYRPAPAPALVPSPASDALESLIVVCSELVSSSNRCWGYIHLLMLKPHQDSATQVRPGGKEP